MSEQANTKIPIGEETYRKLEAIAKNLGLSVAECTDQIVNEFFDHTEFEEVTVKVPRRFMRLLEDQNYFGKTKDSFLTSAIEQAVHIELNELDSEEQDKLLDRYGIDLRLVVNLSHKPLIIGEKHE